MSAYGHANFLANVRDPWLTEAWAEARADAETPEDDA